MLSMRWIANYQVKVVQEKLVRDYGKKNRIGMKSYQLYEKNN